MRILLGISILVLVAIMGTMIAIVRHIRLTRRRNHFMREQQQQEQLRTFSTAPTIRPAASVPPLPARFATPVFPAVPEPAANIPVAASVELPTAPPIENTTVVLSESAPLEAEASMQLLEELTATPSSDPIMSSDLPPANAKPPAIAGISSPRRTIPTPESPAAGPLGLIAAARKLSQGRPAPPDLRPAVPAKPLAKADDYPLRILEFIPDPATNDVYPSSPVFPSLAASAPTNIRQMRPVTPPPSAAPRSALPLQAPHLQATDDPNVRRPVRPAQPPASTAAKPAHRPDWIYFNKDMGDLSDPTPSRIRDRLRSRAH